AACGGGGESVTPPTGPGPGPGPGPTPVDRPTGPFVVGRALFDAQQWIEYTPGDAPLVLIAPHGGLLAPASLPDRSCADCVTSNDTNTQALARAIADTFTARTGKRPHLIVNLLHRRKFDGNRDFPEASAGNATLRAPWEWLHAAVDTARADVARRYTRGLALDLHGHAHSIARLELGYLLTAAQLRLSDAQLLSGGLFAGTSIARLVTDARGAPGGPELLRGATSLGGAPLVGEEYFNGGFNTLRHGSRAGSNEGALDAIQIEHHFTGVRDTELNRARYAAALTDALVELLADRYGWRP
ncbi:MAG: hypothetical protein MUD17_13850, partial [Gemmatimonadaceae bacterium]|nr:hypothetical protein [Gemmatimonadaceae bacterium]